MKPPVDRTVVAELLGISARGNGRLRIYPVALAALNLAFCAAFERLIQLYVQGHYLYLFFFLETAALALFVAGSFLSAEREIVTKTAVMAISGADRFAAVTLRLARRRAVLALVLSTSLFAALQGGGRPLAALAALCSYLLAAALTVSATSLVCLTAMRSSRAALALIVTCALAAGGILLASILLDATKLVPYVPVSAWLTRAFLAVRAGSVAGVLLWNGGMGAALVAVLAAGLGGRSR